MGRPESSRSPLAAIRGLLGLAVLAGGLLAIALGLVPATPTRLDLRAFELLATPRGSVVARGVKLLADIGPLIAVLFLIGLLVVLGRRRQTPGVLVIVVGYPAVLVLDHLAKAAIARPRPTGGLIAAGGYSLPSAEAALSVGLVVIAVTVARLIGRRPTILIEAAAAMIGGIGALMISVRVHYLTDVLAGWALGTAVFAATAAAALQLDARSRTRRV